MFSTVSTISCFYTFVIPLYAAGFISFSYGIAVVSSANQQCCHLLKLLIAGFAQIFACYLAFCVLVRRSHSRHSRLGAVVALTPSLFDYSLLYFWVLQIRRALSPCSVSPAYSSRVADIRDAMPRITVSQYNVLLITWLFSPLSRWNEYFLSSALLRYVLVEIIRLARLFYPRFKYTTISWRVFVFKYSAVYDRWNCIFHSPFKNIVPFFIYLYSLHHSYLNAQVLFSDDTNNAGCMAILSLAFDSLA